MDKQTVVYPKTGIYDSATRKSELLRQSITSTAFNIITLIKRSQTKKGAYL